MAQTDNHIVEIEPNSLETFEIFRAGPKPVRMSKDDMIFSELSKIIQNRPISPEITQSHSKSQNHSKSHQNDSQSLLNVTVQRCWSLQHSAQSSFCSALLYSVHGNARIHTYLTLNLRRSVRVPWVLQLRKHRSWRL